MTVNCAKFEKIWIVHPLWVLTDHIEKRNMQKNQYYLKCALIFVGYLKNWSLPLRLLCKVIWTPPGIFLTAAGEYGKIIMLIIWFLLFLSQSSNDIFVYFCYVFEAVWIFAIFSSIAELRCRGSLLLAISIRLTSMVLISANTPNCNNVVLEKWKKEKAK